MSKAPNCSPLLCRHLLYFTPAVVYFKAQRVAVIKLQDTIYAPVCPGVHSFWWDAVSWPVPPGRGHFCWQGCSAIHWQCGGHRHPEALRQMQQLTKKLCHCWDVKEVFNTKLSTEISLHSPEWQTLDQRDISFINHFTVPTRQKFTEVQFHHGVESSWLLGTTEICIKCPSDFLWVCAPSDVSYSCSRVQKSLLQPIYIHTTLHPGVQGYQEFQLLCVQACLG